LKLSSVKVCNNDLIVTETSRFTVGALADLQKAPGYARFQRAGFQRQTMIEAAHAGSVRTQALFIVSVRRLGKLGR